MMTELSRWRATPNFLLAGGLTLAASGLMACSSEVPAGTMGAVGPVGGAGTTAGTSSTGGMAVGTAGGQGTPTGATGSATGTTGVVIPQPDDCTGSTLGAPKRMVRLTYNQVASSLGSLFGDAYAAQLKTTFEIGDLGDRAFPPLASPREGSLFIESVWTSTDQIAQHAGKYVFDNFAALTGCAAPATAECGQAYVLSLAQQAFRRPLDAAETARLTEVFTEAQTAGGTVEEATQYGAYAVFSSPSFLYRREFGTNVNAEEMLTPYELASQLSYFITDGPPDADLLAAAAGGQLATTDQLALQADRLLATPAGQANLQAAVFAYFKVPALDSVVIDPALAPEFNGGLRNSMRRETELFINYTLWNGLLGDLLLSNTTFVNESMANLYGVAYPAASADADGFAPVQLDPTQRSGLLSNAGFLVGRSRPDVPSVVGRGILINDTVLCAEVPVFPEDLAEQVEAASEMLVGASEREKADYRMGTPPCNGCHIGIDPYGLALENFDIIGKYRTADDQGRPINAAVTLPNGTMTNTLPEVANELVVSGQFATCMAKNLINYSLAEVSTDIKRNSCAVKAVLDRFNQTPQTFSDLIREIAASSTMAIRTPGGM